jgi:hypothetical protein
MTLPNCTLSHTVFVFSVRSSQQTANICMRALIGWSSRMNRNSVHKLYTKCPFHRAQYFIAVVTVSIVKRTAGYSRLLWNTTIYLIKSYRGLTWGPDWCTRWRVADCSPCCPWPAVHNEPTTSRQVAAEGAAAGCRIDPVRTELL